MLDLRGEKNRIYDLWNEGEVFWEDYRDVAGHVGRRLEGPKPN